MALEFGRKTVPSVAMSTYGELDERIREVKASVKKQAKQRAWNPLNRPLLSLNELRKAIMPIMVALGKLPTQIL